MSAFDPIDVTGADGFTPPQLHVRDAADILDKITWIQLIAGSAEHAALIRSAWTC